MKNRLYFSQIRLNIPVPTIDIKNLGTLTLVFSFFQKREIVYTMKNFDKCSANGAGA
jgi:hypothetical protein